MSPVAGRGGLAEEGRLTGLALLLEQLGLAQRGFQRLDELLPMAAQPVARARRHQGLQDALIAEPEIDPRDEVGQRGERPGAPAFDDRGDRPLTHVAHGAQAEADA